eukprot:5258824-Prymnesium_polylepis.1
MVYDQKVPPRVRAADGGTTLARVARFHCDRADRHERRDRLDLGRAGSAGCGARGGLRAPA